MRNPKVSGMILVLCGVFLTYSCIVEPWQVHQTMDAANVPLRLDVRGIMLGVFGITYGPLLLFMPPAMADKDSPVRKLASFVALGISIGFYFIFKGMVGQ